MPKFRHVLPVLALVLATLAFGAGAGTASAKKAPCWKTLLNDWYDGRIDGTYSVRCYHQAIDHLPQDLQDYSQAHDDLNRALQNAILGLGDKGGPLGPDTMLPPSKRGLQSSKKDESFFERLANKLGPGNATSIPLPLLILAGVGLLLVAAAGASVAARRIQARRAHPATVPPAPRNRRK
jgi:hypothetical protein